MKRVTNVSNAWMRKGLKSTSAVRSTRTKQKRGRDGWHAGFKNRGSFIFPVRMRHAEASGRMLPIFRTTDAKCSLIRRSSSTGDLFALGCRWTYPCTEFRSSTGSVSSRMACNDGMHKARLLLADSMAMRASSCACVHPGGGPTSRPAAPVASKESLRLEGSGVAAAGPRAGVATAGGFCGESFAVGGLGSSHCDFATLASVVATRFFRRDRRAAARRRPRSVVGVTPIPFRLPRGILASGASCESLEPASCDAACREADSASGDAVAEAPGCAATPSGDAVSKESAESPAPTALGVGISARLHTKSGMARLSDSGMAKLSDSGRASAIMLSSSKFPHSDQSNSVGNAAMERACVGNASLAASTKSPAKEGLKRAPRGSSGATPSGSQRSGKNGGGTAAGVANDAGRPGHNGPGGNGTGCCACCCSSAPPATAFGGRAVSALSAASGITSSTDASVEETSAAHASPISSSMDPPAADARTTVMMRNLPGFVSRSHLVAAITKQGFSGEFDFVYLPIDFKTGANQGFAFVNLTTPEAAQRFHRAFYRFDSWCPRPGRRCNVSWARADQQGLASNVRRFRNSSVLHPSVPVHHRPLLLKAGREVEFPKPTKKVLAPRESLAKAWA
mmetsp:Transcript_112873/g.315342  ORF Transcript_112873/g.315342 Transcript_112873/m.315342 type:complete len:623 (+) Transcript_112873:307-2175(+)